MKTCTNCRKVKSLTEFYPRSDGRRYAWCKDCMALQVRETDWPPEDQRGGGMLDGGLSLVEDQL